MKLLVIGDEKRVEKFLPDLPVVEQVEVAVAPRGVGDEDIIALCPDAEFLMVDAISPANAALIEALPNLKLIHSEGVAYNKIDCDAAAKRGIFVCNNKGVNAVGVAEQAVLLMLGIQKNVLAADAAVRAGNQIQTKESMMVSGIGELAGMTVGLIGFGDIAREVARRLNAFDMRVVYTKRNRLPEEEEHVLGVQYMRQDELLAQSDFVSLHVPVTDETAGMANDVFFAQMKDGAYLINTARGELVDNEACIRALSSGKLAGAAFDTVAPEPVLPDNPLLNLPENLSKRVLFSPHIGGVTTNMFYRAHKTVWENIDRVVRGERPLFVVNGL